MRKIADPLARSSETAGADAPLFAPREPESPRHRAHRPMAETSLAAHRTSNRSGLRDQVLKLCCRPNGCTIDEAAVELERDCSSVSGRFSELYDAGLIGKAAITRKTRRGKDADVYKTTEAGRASAPQETTWGKRK